MKQMYPKWITPSGGPSLVVWDKATEDRYLGVMAGAPVEDPAPASAEPPAEAEPEAPAVSVPAKKKASR